MSNRSPMPIFLFKRSINPDMIVMIPRPPICIKSNMTTCPNILQADTVGSVTSPVTQVAVVAVKIASIYDTASPLAELIGNAKRPLPMKITTRKLSNIICVVEIANFFFLVIIIPPLKSIKEPHSSSVSWFLLWFTFIVISYFILFVNIQLQEKFIF